MLFNSYEYIFFFLPASLVLFFLLSSRGWTKAAKVSLALSSLFFYGWWDPRYLPLILGSILFNYAVGRTLSHFGEKPESWRKRLLAAGIAGDVLLLGYFKYADFFIVNVNSAAGLHLSLLNIVLPLGSASSPSPRSPTWWMPSGAGQRSTASQTTRSSSPFSPTSWRVRFSTTGR